LNCLPVFGIPFIEQYPLLTYVGLDTDASSSSTFGITGLRAGDYVSAVLCGGLMGARP
jgi:hypothetical protein